MKNPKITQDEIGIIKRAQAGDMSAFNTLFNKYKSFVDYILFGYIKDMDEAKDITNIVFLKVYNKLSLFKDYSSFGGWLRTIANRTAIDWLRETKNKKSTLDSEDERLSFNDNNDSFESDLVNRMTYEQILEKIKKLPEKVKNICFLFYVHGFTVEQISKKLNVPTGTIKSILSRTRKKIKQQF